MSVDDRLRDAFTSDEPEVVDVPGVLREVRTSVRRRQTARRRVVAASGMAAGVALVLLLGFGRGGWRVADPVDAPTATPTVVTSADAVGALEGRWRSSSITRRELRRTLADAGLSRWSDGVVADLPAGPWTLTLDIRGRSWTLSVGTDSTQAVLDRETVVADASRLAISPLAADGTSTYDYSMRTDGAGSPTLTLRFVGTTEPPSSGIPGEAFQRALYTTAPFARATD